MSSYALPATPLRFAHSRGWNLAVGAVTLLLAAYWIEYVATPVDPRGWAGQVFPSMVRSEVLHYGQALVVLLVLALLRPAFGGYARQWWQLALGVQLWHYCEHFLLVLQIGLGWNLGGGPMPSSVLELLVPRVDMHVFYNATVTVPMVIALVLRTRDCGARTPAAHRP